jgi:hypothetical protein
MCKEMQGKTRKNPCISLHSFGRFGAFQRVTANPNKKIPLGLSSPRGLWPEPSQKHNRFSFPRRRPARVVLSGKQKYPNTDFCFFKADISKPFDMSIPATQRPPEVSQSAFRDRNGETSL